MTLHITIEMDNSAFEPEPKHELVRILRQCIGSIDRENIGLTVEDSLGLRDINGNTVGKMEVRA